MYVPSLQVYGTYDGTGTTAHTFVTAGICMYVPSLQVYVCMSRHSASIVQSR